METGHRRSLAVEIVEASAALACAGLVAAIALSLAGRAPTPASLWVVALAAPVGYLAGDAVSGFMHWFCDRFFEVDSPVLGRWFIGPFRDHHVDPCGITRHGFLELNGNSCLAVLPVLLLAWVRGGDGGLFSLFADGFLLFFALSTLATNQFHQWAHASGVPPPVRWLQRRRLILSPEAHAHHHRHDHRTAFCVTSGWLNPLADSSGCWEALERAFTALGVPRARS